MKDFILPTGIPLLNFWVLSRTDDPFIYKVGILLIVIIAIVHGWAMVMHMHAAKRALRGWKETLRQLEKCRRGEIR